MKVTEEELKKVQDKLDEEAKLIPKYKVRLSINGSIPVETEVFEHDFRAIKYLSCKAFSFVPDEKIHEIKCTSYDRASEYISYSRNYKIGDKTYLTHTVRSLEIIKV